MIVSWLIVPEALPYLAVGAVLKGENYWEMLPELAERSRAVEFVG